MSNDDFRSEVISNIDDDIIDKSTKKRAALWGKSPKNSKKLWLTLASAAATV